MKKFLLCGLVFISFTGNDVRATAAMVPVTGDTVPVVPYTGTYQNGVLNTDPKYYDLRVTGNCDTNSSVPAKLEIKGFDTAPNFFRKNNASEIVFAKPSPMAVVQLPQGYTAYVTITLSELTAHESEFKNAVEKYVGLGVHLQGTAEGTYEKILHLSNQTKTFRMNDKNILELVPLASSTAVPTFTPVNDGDAVGKYSPLSSYVETGFDLGSIFKVSVECSETMTIDGSNLEYVGYVDGGSCSIVYANGVFVFAGAQDACYVRIGLHGEDTHIGGGLTEVSIVYFHEKHIISFIHDIAWENNAPFVSDDGGKTWTSDGMSVPGLCAALEKEVLLMQKHGNDSDIYVSSTGIGNWEYRSSISGFIGVCLCYGNGVLVASDSDGYVSTSTNDGVNWSDPVKVFVANNSLYMRIAFGNGIFLALSDDRSLYSSTDGVTWNPVGIIDRNIDSICYGGDEFYMLSEGQLYRLPFTTDLTNK